MKKAQLPSSNQVDSCNELAELAWGLAHPARVAIIKFLRQRGACMCGAIAEHLPLAQSTVSQHLKILKQCGLILGEIDGPRVCYCVNEERLEKAKALTGAL